jgi:predicted transposase YdaD
LLAGVKFSERLIQAYFQEDIMRESVVYQRILREGREQGQEQTKRLILKQLRRRIGEVSDTQQARLESLSFEQIEALAEALLDFESEADLVRWLAQI